MVALDQGALLNASPLASSLAMSVGSVRNYLEVMAGLFLVRFLPPWSGNSRKRLVKSPKLYVRDCGLVHALASLGSWDALVGSSLSGPSWEEFALEQLLQRVPEGVAASYYRSSGGAEVDLILEGRSQTVIALEIKRTLEPRVSQGFRLACDEIRPTRRFYVIPRGESYPLDSHTRAIGLGELLGTIDKLWT